MSKNKFYLHIGTPKTGTTALQEFLYDNQKWLKDHGYSYPDMRRLLWNYRAHRELNFTRNADILRLFSAYNQYKEKIGNSLWKQTWKKLNTELDRYNVIFSSEDIWAWGKEMVEACRNSCEADDFYVIVYLRRQDKFIESNWNQNVKSSMFLESSFQDFFEAKKDKRTFCNYLDKLREIEQVVGKEKLIVRVYEKEQFEGERRDIISDFCSVLGIKTDENDVVVRGRSNARLDINYLEIKRLMNPVLRYWKENRDEHIANIIGFGFRGYFTQRNNGIEGAYLTYEQRKAFIEEMDLQNREIATYYLGREDGRLFYDQRISSYHEEIDEKEIQKDIIESFTYLLLCQQEEIEDIRARQKNPIKWGLNKVKKRLRRQ